MKLVLAVLVGLTATAPSLIAAERVSTVGTARSEQSRLIVWGATDFEELRPAIDGFVQANAGVSVEYHDMQSGDMYQAIRKAPEAAPDLTISSAADLQVKLVNDGLALEHRSAETERLPSWANWRNQAFGITIEPAVIVYSSKLAGERHLLRSRHDLIDLIRREAGALKGRLATYDIAASGVGYLFASHDSLHSSTFATLMKSFGEAGIRLYCCTAEMLDAIERGDALIGYNLLGSYALTRKNRGSPIEVVMPEDYTLLLQRVAVVPRGATHPKLGQLFLDYLLSAQGRAHLAARGMMATTGHAGEAVAQPAILPNSNVTVQPITLSPSLLVFLDPLKHDRFIKAWRALVVAKP
jgi:ABC-type Fe3+ transport system substrate-binding protein